MLGYTRTYQAFAWLLFDYREGLFFSGYKRRLELPQRVSLGQAEGVCFTGPYRGRISGDVAPKLHAFNFASYFMPHTGTSVSRPQVSGHLMVYPNPAADMIPYKCSPGPGTEDP